MISQPARKNSTLRRVLIGTGVAFILFIFYVSFTDKCNMGTNLKDLMLYTTSTLERHGIPYWLDYGSLLGAWRDHDIIPWEFDVDLGIPEEQCDEVLKLRQLFKEQAGYVMYGRGEYIPQKAKWGYNGYIRMPCVRVYDLVTNYYCDIYWYKRLTPLEVLNITRGAPPPKPKGSKLSPPDGLPRSIYPPENWDPLDTREENALLCNDEGFTGELPGGCRKESTMFPLRKMTLFGQEFNIPNDPDEVCRLMYGPNWRKPAPKGYKALVCSWVPSRGVLPFLLLVVTPLAAFVYFRKVHGGRRGARYEGLSLAGEFRHFYRRV